MERGAERPRGVVLKPTRMRSGGHQPGSRVGGEGKRERAGAGGQGRPCAPLGVNAREAPRSEPQYLEKQEEKTQVLRLRASTHALRRRLFGAIIGL